MNENGNWYAVLKLHLFRMELTPITPHRHVKVKLSLCLSKYHAMKTY